MAGSGHRDDARDLDSHWTFRALAEYLRAPLGTIASQIGRILASLDLKPHRVRGWLNPPAGAVLFSADEKTSMQVKSCKRPIRRIRPVRHGTVPLLAAMNVTTGTVHSKIITRNDSATFIEFLTELEQAIEPTKKIHLILDNGSSHTSKQTCQWLSEHPRFTVTYPPTHTTLAHRCHLRSRQNP